MFTVVFDGVRVAHLFSFLCCALVIYVHRGILWSVLLIWFVFSVVLWCVMFSVVFGGVRVAHHGEHKAPKHNIEN
jgi:hypothetical protein